MSYSQRRSVPAGTVVQNGRPRRQASGFGLNVVLSPQTDQRNYPPYEFVEYPKMLLTHADKEYVDAWKKRHAYFDKTSGETSYIGAIPRVGAMVALTANDDDVEYGYAEMVGEPLVALSAEDEERILHAHGIGPAPREHHPLEVEVPKPPQRGSDDRVEKLEGLLEAAMAQNAKLSARLEQLLGGEQEQEPAPKPKLRRMRGKDRLSRPPVIDETSPAETEE